MNKLFKDYIEQNLNDDYTKKEFEDEVDVTTYLFGRMIVDNSDLLKEFLSYELTNEQIKNMRDGLLYSFDDIFKIK